MTNGVIPDNLFVAVLGPVWAFANEYAYDPIGNRQTSSDLGTARTYIANSLNQYTGLSDGVDTFAPQFDDDGQQKSAKPKPKAQGDRDFEATPQEWSEERYSATQRQLYQTLIQTKTGVWSVTYNGENRPIMWECGNTNITMSFDRMGRRVSYTETVGVTTNAHRTFVYDNYLQIANSELTVSNSQLFVWDPTEPVATRPLVWIHNADTYSYTHDGNKNVSEVVDANGAVTAHYEYAPFGDVTVTVGSLASANRFRFSSEYADDALALVRYADRHYGPLSGRWTGRDRAWKLSGSALYAFCLNNPENYFDVAGKMPMRWPILPSDNRTRYPLELINFPVFPFTFPADDISTSVFYSSYLQSDCVCPWWTNRGKRQNHLNYYKHADKKCSIRTDQNILLMKVFKGIDTDNPSSVMPFTSACQQHDKCYARCGATKTNCDRAFLLDMMKLCNVVESSSGKRDCNLWAFLYYQAVVLFGDVSLEWAAGDQSWSALQKDACETCCCE